MGSGVSSPFVVTVRTGDKKGAGTDANIKIKLIDDMEVVSPEIKLDKTFNDDMERNAEDNFKVPAGFPDSGPIRQIEILRDPSGINPDWYINRFEVKHQRLGETYVFPIQRWIKPNTPLRFQWLDTTLPQDDLNQKRRQSELDEKKKNYVYALHVPDTIVQVKTLPDDEKFSEKYQIPLLVTSFKLQSEAIFLKILSVANKWETMDDLAKVYKFCGMPRPMVMNCWSEDRHFAAQRLSGTNPVLITLCEKIPTNFAVNEEMLKPLLEGASLDKIIEEKRLYIVDLKILEGIKCPEGRVLCSPLALFFVNKSNTLMPLAIQLFQVPSETNPVFLPTDDKNVWLLAKMWYNNADAAYHQTLSHLGYTHLLMESFAVCSNRNLSPSHPIFKLLAPHFLYVMAINSLAVSILVAPGGWIDQTMTMGRSGLFHMLAKSWENWRFDVNGVLPKDLEKRGVSDPKFLPNYPYRDDAMLLYGAIEEYVKEIIDLYYDADEKLKKDSEIQNWAAELSKPFNANGCGIKGMPGGGKFNSTDELRTVCTSVIFMCSVGHAAVNFYQYEAYAFPPNYPASMAGHPPKNKDPLDESHLIDALPDKEKTLDTMLMTQTLSQRATKSLGDFEVNYLFDPPALVAVQRFRGKLQKISKTIRSSDSRRKDKYCILDPTIVPNSISI